MNHSKLLLSGTLGSLGTIALALTGALESAPAETSPEAFQDGRTYEVTVTNITQAQIMSPILVATHSSDVALFELGNTASPELALLAEEGMNGPLRTVLDGSSEVADTASGTGMILPGQSETIRITASRDARYLSLASMLVSSNDAFAALNSVLLPTGRSQSHLGRAYDAGSERNSEACEYIPGPPCGNAAHDPAPAEGFVHVSSGIHGIGDVPRETYDWRNPVVQVSISPVR